MFTHIRSSASRRYLHGRDPEGREQQRPDHGDAEEAEAPHTPAVV